MSSLLLLHAAVAVAVLVAPSRPLGAADPPGPALRAGLWRHERSFEYADGRAPGPPVVSELCVDPAAAAGETLAMFRRIGCAAERTQTGPSEWRVTVRCDRPGLPRGSSASVMKVRDPSAYEVRIVNEGGMAMPVARERLSARRLGNC